MTQFGDDIDESEQLLESIAMNLEVLGRSRPRHQPGDVFRVKMPEIGFLFGRVIKVDSPEGEAAMPGADLLQIYAGTSQDGVVTPSALDCDNLLIPPVFTNRLLWTRGYGETIARGPLREEDVLREHYFWDFDIREFRDIRGDIIGGSAETPQGQWLHKSFRFLDDEISEALGVPLAGEAS